MKSKRHPIQFKIAWGILIVLLAGCGQSREPNQNPAEALKQNLPDHIRQLDSLTVYRQNSRQQPDTVELIREQVFESGQDVFIDGLIWKFAVDDSGRVFASTSNAGSAAIYIFDSDCEYITTMATYGHGPGEYESIGTISIQNNKLYMFDAQMQKIGIYSLKDYEHVKDETLNRDQLTASDSLAKRLRGSSLWATHNEQLVMGFQSYSLTPEHDLRKIVYHQVDNDGAILPGTLFELKRFRFYFPGNSYPKDLPMAMPFTRSSLLSVSDDGCFFTAWTEDFLIKEYNADGDYQRAIYYPVKKSKLHTNELDLGQYKRNLIKNKDLPETWPALHAMELDDEGRLWVATITDSDSTYTWWVLSNEGKLLAKFRWSGERASRSVMSTPEIVIKNGYLYKREVDIRAGINRVAQYRIRFSKQ
ncbi:6-bladed beta-propeller [Aliifodinibius sp. S!AR15-10]|uniref:6-bladed beta-propeller n=1 Tax=Aliifodinibius sp. S!AR15-10 TaxID=2950437 RepID=UPI00286195C2|nr:6-bladed beta-propeller [Aliifodinibius sp. S!AR15-10]MDR8393832.1 6-bladed beta-propeller [Aliifodinibius sp. S!AR15-10]